MAALYVIFDVIGALFVLSWLLFGAWIVAGRVAQRRVAEKPLG